MALFLRVVKLDMSKIVQLNEKKDEPLSIKSVISHLMKSTGTTPKQLSVNTGLAYTTVLRICNEENSNPTADSLTKISSFFNITVTQLMGHEPLNHDGSYTPNSENWLSVPLISFSQATNWPDNRQSIQENIDDNFILTDIETHDEMFAIKVPDDRLEPKFPRDTLLIFDPRKKPQHKDFALLLENEQPQPNFRQLLVDGPDLYSLSVNPLFSPDQMTKVLNTTRVIGVLAQAKSTFT